MKAKLLLAVLFLGSSISFASGDGPGNSGVGTLSAILVHNKKPVNSPARGNALVAELLKAAEQDEEIDVCYDEEYEAALENTQKKTQNEIGINLIDVYGESMYPNISVEFTSRDGGSSASTLISPCRY